LERMVKGEGGRLRDMNATEEEVAVSDVTSDIG